MSETRPGAELSSAAASEAAKSIGRRYALATLIVSVPVRSLAEASKVAAAAVAASAQDADGHLTADRAPGRARRGAMILG
jgi:hypothetical protein